MQSQACEPCAKRKVRCDREEPCSNCKRRKQDRCTYPEASPFDRIKRLEGLVRSLGGDPGSNARLAARSTETAAVPASHIPQRSLETASFAEGKSKDPVIIEEDGETLYLESRAWHSWLGKGHDDSDERDIVAENPFLTRNYPHALQGIFFGRSSIDLASRYPSQQDAITLWKIFNLRVNPVVRISFNWALMLLHSASMHPEYQKQFTDAEHALMFSLYLSSVISLSDEDCRREMHQPRSLLIAEFHTLCEEAFSRNNLLCMTDITVLQALAVYIAAGIDRLSTQSLWSLMGLVIRNAEKLGIHRDGNLLGLSPLETEQRRRLWWQLQHLDLALAVRSGLTPQTLNADWDTKMPLNIEDDDINATMTSFPKERKGMTSMSYCLLTYWVIDQQRRFFHADKGRFELSWQSNESLPQPVKESLIQKLEEGVNKKFLQYCDPLRPLDLLIQLLARMLICGMRQRILHPLACAGNLDNTGGDLRGELLTACMQSLEYNVAMHSQPSIRHFQWLTKGFFPWQSFMCVLVEASQQNDESRTQRIWDLLSDLYVANSMLSRLSEDRRRSHAARLVVAAWKARQSKLAPSQYIPKPDFVTHLEYQLSEVRSGPVVPYDTKISPQEIANDSAQPVIPETFLEDQDMNAVFDLDFQDIDWSFWSSVD
ncbi:hypothetical protein ACLMJK_000857 [Lecanora helva]